ncbi:MAG: hypothetical protein KDD42_01270 [Bdellovibrionales bacterium]|nr:hypothetical protein [Bdellovibrionales bacterium]
MSPVVVRNNPINSAKIDGTGFGSLSLKPNEVAIRLDVHDLVNTLDPRLNPINTVSERSSESEQVPDTEFLDGRSALIERLLPAAGMLETALVLEEAESRDFNNRFPGTDKIQQKLEYGPLSLLNSRQEQNGI